MKRRGVVIAAVIAMVAVGLGVTWISTLPTVWLLILLATALSGAPFIVAVVRHQLNSFEPVYLFALSYLVLFAVHPAAALLASGGAPVFVGYAVEPTYVTALAIGAIGAILFYLGYYLPLGRNLGSRLPLPSEQWSQASLTVFVVICVLVSMGALTIFLLTNGGLSVLGAFLNGRSGVTLTALRESSGYLYSAPLFLAPVGILIVSLSGQRWRGGALLGLLLVALSQVLAFGLGDRSWTLPTVAALFLVWHVQRNRQPRLSVVAIALVVTFVFGITLPRQYRTSETRSSSLTELLIADIVNPGQALQDFFAREDTAMADGLAVELQFVPDTVPFQLGRTYLEAASRPVPRAVWTDKPRAAEVQLMATMWPQLASAGVQFYFSVFGEPYLNFGLVGVIVISLLFGLFWRALYTWFTRAPTNPFVMCFYALSWPFLFVYMRGGIGADYQRHLIYLLPAVLAYFFARRSRITLPNALLPRHSEASWHALDSAVSP
jgi:O-antigen polysaccharide polymerase Wzy